MKRIGYHTLAALAGLTFAAAAFATPIPNSAVVHERVWNDCPITTLTTTNLYPASIQISDQNATAPFCVGFANLNTWRFSTDGVNPIEFQNGDAFEYSCTLVLNGIGEGGLNLAPWWGPDADGLFNVRTTDGEIACFGGRLPFYSFTGAHALVYVNNTPIELKVTYQPNGLSAGSPATVVYEVRYNAVSYSSGPLAFDQGNAAEDPPHGQWGALNPWYAGGHMKTFMFPSGQAHGIVGTWSEITASTPPVATSGSSWGRLKLLYK
jgi:hypothetical protein